MLRPAIHSTEDPPIPIEDLRLREYVFELRRRIEVQNVLLESLAEDAKRFKKERDECASELERLRVDLHWHESRFTMEP